MSLKRAVDGFVLEALRATPRQLAAHVMHLLRQHPAVADSREFEPKLCVHWLETDFPDQMHALLPGSTHTGAARGASFWMAHR